MLGIFQRGIFWPKLNETDFKTILGKGNTLQKILQSKNCSVVLPGSAEARFRLWVMGMAALVDSAEACIYTSS